MHQLLASPINLLTHYAKGTLFFTQLLTILGFMLFHTRYPGTFHLSLTVLVHYRSCLTRRLRWWATYIRATLREDRSTQAFYLNGSYGTLPSMVQKTKLVSDVSGKRTDLLPAFARHY